MPLTAVNIANQALVMVGADKITALADPVDRARVINEIFETTRDAVLRAHPWNFATQRVTRLAYTKPVATLTPGATTGSAVTFTASAAVFAATDVGKVLQGGALPANGQATITGFTSTTVVTATITTAFADTSAIASQTWRMYYTPPAWGFTYSFLIPSNVLRIWRIEPPETVHQVETDATDRYIVANVEELDLRWILQVTDPAKFSPMFVKAFVAYLASEITEPLGGQLSKARSALEKYRLVLAEARSVDTKEGTQERADANDLINVRQGGSGE